MKIEKINGKNYEERVNEGVKRRRRGGGEGGGGGGGELKVR